MRQSVLRTDTQPLGTGRQPLDAVGRGLFPCAACFCFYPPVFSPARPVFGFTCDSSFSQASYAPIRASHGYAAAWDGSPSAGADGRLFFSHARLVFAFTLLFFPCTACFWLYLRFFFLPSELCVNYVRYAHIIARAAWDGPPSADADGRLFFSHARAV